MKMTSLKMTAAEAKSEFGYDGPSVSPASKPNLPKYPYGTKIRLETEVLDKLGIDLSDYPEGMKCEIVCKVEVVGFSSSQRQGGKARKELELQITDMSITEDGAVKKAKSASKHLESISGSTDGDDYED